MIIKNPEEKEEFDKIPNVDENGDPIYKIDNEDLSEKSTGELIEIGDDSNTADDSEFKDTLQDLKDTTSQEQFVNLHRLRSTSEDGETNKRRANITLNLLLFTIGFWCFMFAFLGLVLRYASEKEKTEQLFPIFIFLAIINIIWAMIYAFTGVLLGG